MARLVVDKAGLMAVLQPLTGLSQFAVFWDLDPNRPDNPVDRGHVTLRMRIYAPYGVDQHMTSYDAGTGKLSTYTIGQRQVRITLLAQVFDYDLEASELLEKVRVGIFDPNVLAALNALKLAFQTCSPTADVPVAVEDRWVNCASMDLFLGASVQTDPVVPADGTPGWIQTVDTNNIIPITVT